MQMNKTQKNTQQNHLRKILIENFSTLKMKNPSYSLRAYARKLAVGPAALSEMMSGKRPITSKTSDKIFERLHLSPVEKEKLSKLERSKKALENENNKYIQVEMDQYHLISDWYYFGILSLAETEDFQDSPEWIARRLNIKIQEAKKALQTLERLQLLKRNDQGTLVLTGIALKTSSDVSHVALRKSHVDNLELAKNSLEKDEVSIRDFSSMTMAIDPDLLPEAKKLIQDFRRKLTQFLESEKKQEVYKLNIQLFPLSEKETNL